MKRKTYSASEFSRELFATALAHTPGASLSSAEILISAGIRSFFEEVKLTELIGEEKVNEGIPCAFTPSQPELTKMVEEEVAKNC